MTKTKSKSVGPRVKMLLTRGERQFRSFLESVVATVSRREGVDLQVHCQVPIKAIIPLGEPGGTFEERLSKHERWIHKTGVFDFVVTCGPSYPLAAVEYDADSRHRVDQETVRRDRSKDKVCACAGFRLRRLESTGHRDEVVNALTSALAHAPRARPALAVFLDKGGTEDEYVVDPDSGDADLSEIDESLTHRGAEKVEELRPWLRELEAFGPDVVRRAMWALGNYSWQKTRKEADLKAVVDMEQGILNGTLPVERFDCSPCLHCAIKAVRATTLRPELVESYMLETAYEFGSGYQARGAIKWALLPWAEGEVDPIQRLYFEP
ncbi:DUF2726 domain-containing protein [Planctomycetota bacterium]|nr:DUF2726 domain-containing protein [Planctomycetota bacterium]